MQQVGQTLSDLYESSEHMAAWNLSYTPSTDSQNFRYVKTVAQAMGGDVEEAFTFMEENTYYDIAAGKNKYPISFEVFLPYYNVPFLFMAPEGSIYDRLTFAHEFGHYANDYLCGGSYAGTDVAEVHSQAMEYLSLLYGKNTTTLTRLKMADSPPLRCLNISCTICRERN